MEELDDSLYSLTNSEIRARSVLYVNNSIPAQILAYHAWRHRAGYPFNRPEVDWKNWLLAARSVENVNISAANEMKRRGLALRLYVWQSLTAGTQHYCAGQENPYAQHWRIGNNTVPVVQDIVTASNLLVDLYEFKTHLQQE